jgi:prephenate dehydratase
MSERLKLGALGGPHTFNAQAAKVMLERYAQFADIVYFPTSNDVIQAVLGGHADAACAPEQTSKRGFHAGMAARMLAPNSRLQVIAEIARRYCCSLLGKPGSNLGQVRHVFGHDGSIEHSRSWLESNLPAAPIKIVGTNSELAARLALDSDGSIASVGSPELAAKLGLAELAKEIDDGSVVNYWAISLRQPDCAAPNRLLVAGRFGNDAQLGALILAMGDIGYLLRTVHSQAAGRTLYEYDYMLRFAGTGTLGAARDVVSCFGSARLAGAWEARQ